MHGPIGKNIMIRLKNTRLASAVLGSTLGVLLGVGSAFANPVDPTVVVGDVSLETVGAQLNITNSSGAIIDWNRFSIAQDEITKFIQESSSSAVLNRVTGGNLSEILGDLQSNGRVFLINPNGLIVGQDAVIDTAGFVGSTLGITNQAFSSENYTFSGDGGAIENHGLIHVTANGDIALIASSVENSGVLRSDNGDILLAAGKAVSLSFDDLQDLRFEVQAPAGQAVNLGNIIAGGGNASILGGQVTNGGSVELIKSPDGRIFLQATETAIVSGRLKSNGGDINVEARQVELRDASVDSGTDDGSGDISLLGDNVGLFSGTKISASSNRGGGTVLIGGEQQGRGNTRTSDFVYLDENASVESSGGNTGDGGRVILFAENSARINGAITARGGELSGDGGFIETSGLIGLRVNATPDAGANNGTPGEWLIDPNNISIENSETLGLDLMAPDGEFIAISGGAVVSSEIIVNALEINDVTIDTGTTGTEAGDININVAIVSGLSRRPVPLTTSLTLNAANNININASVSLVGTDRTLQFNSAQDGGTGS
ncbi:MAG: filamentous hemagglutinin family protein, partial [Arenicella sp.]